MTIVALSLGFNSVHAQERAAGGTVETQMTWSALSSLVNAASAKADAVNSRVDQAVVCGKKGMVYAPGAAGVDGAGCISAQYVNSIVSCGNQGKIYNATSNACVVPGELTSIINCGNQKKVYSSTTKTCVEVEGGTRWYASGSGPGSSGGVGGGSSRSGIERALKNAGISECGSAMSVGKKCTTQGSQCAIVSREDRSCGSQGDRTCTDYSSTIYRCD